MKELKAKLAEVKNMYISSRSYVTKTLERIFGKEPFEFNYRDITCFDDACKHLNISNDVPTNREYFVIDEQAAEQSAAMYKLMVICKALCNGKYTDENGGSWFPYYWLVSKQVLEIMGEEQRKAKGIQLLSACNVSGAEYAGVLGEGAVLRDANTAAYYGFPLYANSKEMAEYLDEQFRDLIYKCYGIKVNQENK